MDAFGRAFEIVTDPSVEGHLSLDPNDRGNWTTGVVGKGELRGTKYGISAMRYPDIDIRNLTLGEAKWLYRHDYWNESGCDDLPWPLSCFVFDAAVNQGVGAAIRLLQRSLDVTDDGIFGQQTKLAARRATPWHAARFMNLRVKRYMETAGFDRYGDGWITRSFLVAVKTGETTQSISETST